MKDIYNLNNYTKYINDIVNRPIWQKEKKEEVIEKITDKENCVTTIVNTKTVYTDKINYVAFDYVTEQDKEDVKQCVILTLLEVLDRAKKTGYLDKKQRYSIRDKSAEQAIRLIVKFTRNASAYKIYKILKHKFVSLEECCNIQAEERIDKEVLQKMIIKNAVINFLKDRDKLDTLLFFSTFGEITLDFSIFNNIQKVKLLNADSKDIAYMCNASLRTVQYRRKKLVEDFKVVYLKDIKPYL